MNRAVATRLLKAQTGSPDDVWNWYLFQRQVLGEEMARAQAALGTAEPFPGSELERYVGKTVDDLNALFAGQVSELEMLTMLGMLAATEGRLQSDFLARIDQRLKDKVSRTFQNAKKRRVDGHERVDLVDDILDTWRDHGPGTAARNAVVHFKAALNLRHWLAHGRYWVARLGRDYSVQDVRVICIDLVDTLGI